MDEYGGLLSTLLLHYAQQLQEEWCLNHAEGRCYACMQLLACLITVSRGVACSNIATSSEGWHTDGDL